MASYLEDIAFQTCNAGPYIGGQRHNGRDPSIEQIAERCSVIRQHVPRPPVGPTWRWELPSATGGLAFSETHGL